MAKLTVNHTINTIDDWLHAGNFVAVDRLLTIVNEHDQSLPVLITILGITLGAKDKLKNRESFYDRVYACEVKYRGIEKTDKLLLKYR